MLVYFGRKCIGTWEFSSRELLEKPQTSSSLGALSRSVFVSTCVRLAIASALISAGLLRTALKCSAHLFRMAGLSVIIVVPSTLNKGDVLDYCGP